MVCRVFAMRIVLRCLTAEASVYDGVAKRVEGMDLNRGHSR